MSGPLPGQMAFNFFDPQGGAAARDAGIAHAEAGAPAVALADAEAAVRAVADAQPTLTTDDVWAELEAAGAPSFPEPRAMGAVMRRAQEAGVIAPLTEWRLSERRACHRRPVRVWLSLVRGGAAA